MEIKSMIQQGRRRLYVCRIVKKITLSAMVSIVACGVIVAFIRFGVDVPGWCWGIAVVPWAVLFVWAWPWRFSDIEIARQMDSANSFGDRLSSSLSFMNEEKQTEWMKVQIEDTKKRTSDTAFCESLIKTAFHVECPEHLKWLCWGVFFSLVIIFLPDIVKLIEAKKASEPVVEISKEEQFQSNLDVVSQEIRKEQAEQLLEEAEKIDDPELKEAAKELAQILEDDRAGKLSREEFERRLAALERKLEQSESVSEPEQQAFDKSVREAVESMPEMHEDPETQELAKALEKNDYDKAADILKDLLNSTDPKDKKKLEKLAKMFGDLAKKIDPTDPELKEALKKNRDLVNQLKKELDNDKLSSEDKKAFQDAEKKLKEAEREQKSLENQKQEQQKQANDKASQALNKLSKALDNTSKDLEKKQDAGEKEDPNAEEAKEVKSGEQQDGKQQENVQQQQQDVQQQQQDGQQQQQDGQQQQQDVQQQQLDGQQQQLDGQQQQQDGQQQQQDGASGEDGQSAEEALREAAENKKAQKQRDALKDLTEKMRKDAQESGKEKDEKAEERQKNMQDFMDRAKGQDKSEEQAQKRDESGEQAGKQGANGESGQGDKPEAGIEKTPSEGKDGSEDGKELGNEPGVGHDTSEGESTSMDVKLKDEKLSGMETGDTTGAIIESAGQQGFASESYKEVYQTYEKAAEEILETEEVPQGYKNYVEKYFDMIRPQ